MTPMNKYGNVLTVLLVILIIGVLIGVGVLFYNLVIKPRIDKNRSIEAIAEFDKIVEDNNNNTNQDDDFSNLISVPDEDNNNYSTKKSKVYYQGFVMLGYITIPKTDVKQPILDEVTPNSLNTAVAIIYPSNAQLNQPGNVVIIGHNYRDGRFFSNNKKLNVGDKIKIKDNSGTELTYTIYQKFQTTEQDTSFYTRDTKGKTEITLSTCTDDAKMRIIILARAD